MIAALSTPRNKTKTFVLLAVCAVLAVAAGILGMDDNPPGILSAYLAAAAFVLAFVHPWRTTRQFGILFAASLLGLVLLVILNNLFAAVAHDPGTTGALMYIMQGLAVTAFILGTLICPAALLIGAVGSVVMFIKNRWRPK